MKALEVEGLRKEFGGVTAVDDLSFTVDRGSVTGLIGPNGAGKTTTFDLVSGFLEPDGGSVYYMGRDTQELMTSSRDERVIWSGYSALSLGALGYAVAAYLGMSQISAGAAGAGGAGAGAGLYDVVDRGRRMMGARSTRPFRLAQEGLVRTFQITRELREMTVLENLMLAAPEQKGESLLRSWLRRDDVMAEEDDVRERASRLLDLLEIDHLADERAGGLSGGQRKLLELGRVLMTDPEVVMLDEPVAGVNPTLTNKITDRVSSLRDDGYTFLMVEHDMDVIMGLSDEVVVMSEGRKVVQGPPDEVREDERVLDAYLGGV